MTQNQKTRAYEMIASGEYTTAQIARRVRISEGSVAALRAVFTRTNASSAPSRSTSSSSTASSSASSDAPVVVRIRNQRLSQALRDGKNVELRFDVSL